MGAFLVLHCAENVWGQAGAIGRTDHWAANKMSGQVVFRRSSVLLLPWCGGSVPPGGPNTLKVLPWVVVGAGGLGAGKTSGAGTRGVFLDVVIGGRTRDTDTNGGESSDNRSKVHADCGPAENPSL